MDSRSASTVVARLDHLIERRSLLIALVQAVARLMTMMGVLLLTLWSYSVWGSDESPLARLLFPGLLLLALGIAFGVIFDRLMTPIRRALRRYLKNLHKANQAK